MLSLGLGVWVWTLNGPAPQLTSPPAVSNLVISDRDRIEPTNKPARVTVGGLNPYALSHDGFLGFLDLRPENKASVLTAEEPEIYLRRHPPLEADEDLSFSINEGEGEGIYITDDYATAAPPVGPQAERTPLTRDVVVVRRIDPEYPFVARADGKEGNITVLVYIDSTGELTIFPDWVGGDGIQTLEYTTGSTRSIINYAVKEEPPGWFFAQSFIKVLPEWVFAPSIRDGRPISSMLRIKYRFCLGSNCLRYELEQLES